MNFDIWWEVYRNSPYYDPQFHFDFFYNRQQSYKKTNPDIIDHDEITDDHIIKK